MVVIGPSRLRRGIVGVLIKADFKTKLTPCLSKYRPQNKNPEYQKEIFFLNYSPGFHSSMHM
jgi:hypothetical protein